jgi:uncharacterized protein YacL
MIWFIFTIIAGQLGIFVNFIVRYYSYHNSIATSVYLDSISGSFYIFSIATVASMLGPLFINILSAEKLRFKTLKVLTTIITIFFLFFSGIVYSVIQSKTDSHLDKLTFHIDWTQTIVYVVSLFICFYVYCILKLDEQMKKYGHLNDPIFSEADNKRVAKVTQESKLVIDDGKGNKL